MKRLRRWLGAAFAMLSLLLVAGTVFLWVRSHQYLDAAHHATGKPNGDESIFWVFTGPNVLEFAGGPEATTCMDYSRLRGLFFNSKSPVVTPQANGSTTLFMQTPPTSRYQLGVLPAAPAATQQNAFQFGGTGGSFSLTPGNQIGALSIVPSQALSQNTNSNLTISGANPVIVSSPPSSNPPISPTRSFSTYAGTLTLNHVFHTGWQRPVHGFAGIRWETSADMPGIIKPYWRFDIPFWLLFLVFCVLPMLKLRKLWREYSRPKQGLCSTCGYDLRATPNRCPECGSVPAAIR